MGIQYVIQNPWVRAGITLAALAGMFLAAYLLSFVLVPLFFAFMVAYIFDPLIDIFERRKVPRMAAILVLVGTITLGGVFMPIIALPSLVLEAQEMIDGARTDGDNRWINRALDQLPWEKLAVEMGWDPAVAEGNPRAFLAERLGNWIKVNAVAFVQQHATELANVGRTAGASLAEVLQSVGSSILGFVLMIGNVALFAFVAIYMLNDYDRIVARGGELVPPRYRRKVGEIMSRIDLQLRGFMRGQATVCACLGAMYSIGFLIADVPFALTLGVFGGLASFVPYLGLVLTIGPAVLFTLLKHGVDLHLVGVLLTFVIAQGLEGNFLTPRIVGSQVGLGPVWVILAIMVFGSTLGFTGMLLAVPLAAVLKVLVAEALDLYLESSFFGGTVAAPAGIPPEGVVIVVPDSVDS